MTDFLRAISSLLCGLLVTACATRIPAAAVTWNDSAPHLAPAGDAAPGSAATGVGYLRVETDTDVRVNGSLGYDNPRRPFDVYSSAGELVRADIDNRGGRNGEEPLVLSLPAGRYVVASVYGTTYRKVQVEIAPGARTEVFEATLRDAPAVLSR